MANARPYARDIDKNFVNGVKPVIAFQHDGRWRVTHYYVPQQVECFFRNRVGMRIGQKEPLRVILLHDNPSRHVNFAHDPRRKCVDERIRVEPMIDGVEIKIFDVEQNARSGFRDKLG